MRIVLLIGLLFYALSTSAQDIISFDKKTPPDSWVHQGNSYQLTGKNIRSAKMNFIQSLSNALPVSICSRSQDTCHLPPLLLSRCKVTGPDYRDKSAYGDSVMRNFVVEQNFSINHSSLYTFFSIENLTIHPRGSMMLDNDTFPDLSIANYTGLLSIQSCRINSGVEIALSDINSLVIMTNELDQSDPSKIKVANSVIRNCFIKDNRTHHAQFFFLRDSLSGKFSLSPLLELNRGNDDNHLLFEDCYVDADMEVLDFMKNITVQFRHCRFGSHFNIASLQSASLIFENCSYSAQVIDLNTILCDDINISFINTDLKNFNLNYSGKFQLFFPSGTSDEDRISTFENLLSKFKLEGKLNSYQNVDIEYINYQNSKNGLWGKIINLIDRAWWYYGYRKYYILYWTFGLLLLFFLLNMWLWNDIQSIYPIIPLESSSYYDRVHYWQHRYRRRLASIFIFTAFIFFSLRVDFDKLSYRSTRLLAYFFIQYITGLICVFFIANAILKIA